MRRETTSQRKRALTASLAFPWLLSCAQIAGTNDYEVKADAPEETPLQTEPEEPPLPFLAGSPECEACASDKCGLQLAACDESEVCAGWLADVRARPTPMAAYERFQIEGELSWRSDRDGELFDDSVQNLRACAQKCVGACRLGQNFSCIGDFEWELPAPQVLRVGIGLNGAAVDAEIAACSQADHCDKPLASSATDEDGFAELRLSPSAASQSSINYLQFTRKDDALPWQWVQSRPFADNDYIPLSLIDDSNFKKWHQDFGRVFSGESGVMLVTPVDCAGISAKQVRIEAWRYYGGNAPQPCGDCFYAYAEDVVSGIPSATVEGFTTTGTMGYIAAVSPGLVWVLLRRLAEPHEVVSATRVLVRGGEVAIVRAHPASTLELSLFSPARN